MHDAGSRNVIECQGDLDGVVHGLGDGQSSAFEDQVADGATAGEFVGDEIEPVLCSGVEHAGDIVVIQLSTGAGFVAKASDQRWIAGRAWMQNFESDIPGQFKVHGEKDGAHATGTQTLSDFEMCDADSCLFTGGHAVGGEQAVQQLFADRECGRGV